MDSNSNSKSGLNPLYDAATDRMDIHEESQARINKPLEGGQLNAMQKGLLEKLHALKASGTLKPYEPSSLYDLSAYDALEPEKRAQVDQASVSMLAKIRSILDLDTASMDTNYQVANLLDALNHSRERMQLPENFFIF